MIYLIYLSDMWTVLDVNGIPDWSSSFRTTGPQNFRQRGTIKSTRRHLT